MRTGFITLGTATLMTLFLTAVYAQGGKGIQIDPSDVYITETEKQQPSELEADNQSHPVLDEPVDFSTARKTEKSFQKVLGKAGKREADRLSGALQYLLYYDLSVGGNEQALHKKLNGKTPNQIFAMAKSFK